MDYDLATPDQLLSMEAEYPCQVRTHIADVRDVDALVAAAALAVETFELLDAAVAAAASAAGTRGLFHLAGYNAAKHAVVGLVKGLAADLYDLEHVEQFASSQLVQRLLSPSEIAATIAFCCSREGAVLNGSVVDASGGFTG